MNIPVKLLFRCGVHKLIILKLIFRAGINRRFENSDNLIGLFHIKRVKAEGLVFLPKFFAFELFKVGKHCAILHMMTVNNQVVRRLIHITAFAHIGTAVIGVFLVKAVFQVEVQILRRLHNGIVDQRIVNSNPSHNIAVLLIEFCVLREHYRFSLRSFGSLACFVFFYDFRKTVVDFLLRMRFLEMTVYHHSAEHHHKQEKADN